MCVCVFVCYFATKFTKIWILTSRQGLYSRKNFLGWLPLHSAAHRENTTSVQCVMTWCFGFNYETGGKRTKNKKKRRGGRRKTMVKFGLCDESSPSSKTRILMSIFSHKRGPILLHWNLTEKSSLLPSVSIRFLIAVVLFFVVYVGPTGRSFINHWTNLYSPLFSFTLLPSHSLTINHSRTQKSPHVSDRTLSP